MTRTVLLVDDHAVFRQGVRALIDRQFTVVGECATTTDALELVTRLAPDVVLLDVELPGPPAPQTIATIRRLSPRTAIVVLTMHRDHVLERELRHAGASDYLPKSIGEAELRRAIASAAPISVPPGREAEPGQVRPILTPRETSVLRLIAQAYTNQEIATRLGIAEGTVKRHTTNLYARLGATSRIDAVRRATVLGLFTESE